MTHTSTEQPEALRLASALRGYKSMFIESVAADFEAAAKLLEASQAQRVPVDYHEIAMAHQHIGAHGQLEATERIVRWTEARHGITQEKQG